MVWRADYSRLAELIKTWAVVRERSKLPKLQFLVIDPLVGLNEKTIVDFMREEGYFTHLIEEREFGTFKVQKRQSY